MSSRLSDPLLALLDGSDLDAKIGTTILFVAAEPGGWPRIATLSVGELLAVSPEEVLITLYRSSRTTQAAAATGRATLMAVEGNGLVKIEVVLESIDVDSPGRTVFRATVVTVQHDEVPYARVTHGVEFELVEGTRAVERWRLQLDELRAAGAR
jgi:hypothetical protein